MCQNRDEEAIMVHASIRNNIALLAVEAHKARSCGRRQGTGACKAGYLNA